MWGIIILIIIYLVFKSNANRKKSKKRNEEIIKLKLEWQEKKRRVEEIQRKNSEKVSKLKLPDPAQILQEYKSMEGLMWENNTYNFYEVFVDFDRQMITRSFYISSYVCPKCGKALYKTVFPNGYEYPIMTELGKIRLKRVFTCPNCRIFYAPAPGYRLYNGNGFNLSCSLNEYDKLLTFMTNVGGVKGRKDI